ncbi:MAG: class I SAM-dependent methyltransferase [Pseudomonadales bacterium]|nr:class I SAM-dependent methyltransferase [Pseudomonadales bacterium]
MKDADWLNRWMNELLVHSKGCPVLELGCGRGYDTQVLTDNGFEVIALDLSLDALGHCSDIENSLLVNADLSCSLPFADNTFSFVLASLSLHYFSWQQTLAIAAEIRRVMIGGGMLLMRVNSTDDVNFGAAQANEIDTNYYVYKGQKKRFFLKADVERMLQEMTVIELWHESIDRYGKEKNVWVAHAIA